MMHLKSESSMMNMEDRINKIELNTKVEVQEYINSVQEEILESVKKGVEKLVDSRNRELEDRKRGDLNLTIFDITKKNSE